MTMFSVVSVPPSSAHAPGNPLRASSRPMMVDRGHCTDKDESPSGPEGAVTALNCSKVSQHQSTIDAN
jgi:hypothetical protein